MCPCLGDRQGIERRVSEGARCIIGNGTLGRNTVDASDLGNGVDPAVQ